MFERETAQLNGNSLPLQHYSKDMKASETKDFEKKEFQHKAAMQT